MHIYISESNEPVYPYSFDRLRRDNPDTSFPSDPTEEQLARWNVFPVEPTERPASDHTQNVVEVTPEMVDGVWHQVWVLEDASIETIAQRTSEKVSEIKAKRNRLLSQSDWTQLPDVPVELSAGWSEYRSKLREITDHPGFPWNVEWPTSPTDTPAS